MKKLALILLVALASGCTKETVCYKCQINYVIYPDIPNGVQYSKTIEGIPFESCFQDLSAVDFYEKEVTSTFKAAHDTIMFNGEVIELADRQMVRVQSGACGKK